MKKHLLLGLMVLTTLLSCRKEVKDPITQTEEVGIRDGCSMLFPEGYVPVLKSGYLNHSTNKVYGAVPTIYLVVDGMTIYYPSAWTLYYGNNDIVCNSSGLSSNQLDTVIKLVKDDFAPFDVIVSTDSNDYNSAPEDRRIKILVSSTNVFGLGAAYMNSFFMNDPVHYEPGGVIYTDQGNTPPLSLVRIANNISHEAGHTMGLRHQSLYSGSTLINEYHPGSSPAGISAWSPTMGGALGQSLSTWHGGPTDIAYNDFQVDDDIISALCDRVSDEEPSTIKVNTPVLYVSTLYDYVLESADDSDLFKFNNTGGSVSVEVTSKGNLDIAIDIFDNTGSYVTTHDPSNNPSESFHVNASTLMYFRVRRTYTNSNIHSLARMQGGYKIWIE